METQLITGVNINTTLLSELLKEMGKTDNKLEARIKKYIKNPDHFIAVITNNDIYCGYAWTQSYGENLRSGDIKARLHDIYISKNYRKKGFAKKLLDEVINWSKSEGVTYLEWQASVEAVGFYTRLGYKPDYESDLKEYPFFEIHFN